jgi:glycosyltransferase involved in cell wall biosynthesis
MSRVERDAAPELTVVVPATDRPSTLAHSLAAIRAASDPPEELIVVDEPRGVGPAEARNRGSSTAKGDVIVFVDSDVVVHADAFQRIRDRFVRDPALAGLFGAYDDRPEAPGLVSRFRNLLHHHVHVESAGPVPSFWAGLGAIRRDALTEIGGFDAERYPGPSIEDIELGHRLAERGYRVELDPSIRGTHLKEWSLSSMVQTDLLQRGAPWIALMLERRSWPATLNLGHRHRVSAFASVALVAGVLGRRPRVVLASLATLLIANRSFYGLLRRRLGARALPLGVALHVLHQLVALVAVPVGIALRARRVAERRDASH